MHTCDAFVSTNVSVCVCQRMLKGKRKKEKHYENNKNPNITSRAVSAEPTDLMTNRREEMSKERERKKTTVKIGMNSEKSVVFLHKVGKCLISIRPVCVHITLCLHSELSSLLFALMSESIQSNPIQYICK